MTITNDLAVLAGGAGGGMSFRNRLINGNMAIDQRYAGTATANTINSYVIDRWAGYQSTFGKIVVQQNAGSVTPPVGFANYLGATSQSSYSVLSSDYYVFLQPIEGYNFADLNWGTANAKTVTLSFWVYSSLTGTFGGSLKNGANNYCYPFSYTISSSNTWTYITITIAGPTSGTWIGATNGQAVSVNFGMGVGSSYSASAGSWQSGNYLGATGAVSVVGTSGATFYITGVQFEVGSAATPFEHRHYGLELSLCQRYCYRPVGTDVHNWLSGSGGWGSTTNALIGGTFPVQMRATPSLTTDSATLSNYAVYATSGGTFSAVTSLSVNPVTGTFNYLLSVGTGSGGTTGTVCYLSQNGQTTYGLYWSAEL